MFGYVTINPAVLDDKEKQRYQAVYCGLCRQLGASHGGFGRMTLTYDLAFLSMLRSSLGREEETEGTQRCPIHPFRKMPYALSPATAYAADMSVILAYYKNIDDWRDDHNVAAYTKSKILQRHVAEAQSRWPRQCAAVKDGIRRLGEMEKANELNPDIPANCFGELMGELFYVDESPSLRQMGAALGRFIYLIDAVNDLHNDIRKKRYNPLVAQPSADFTPILTMLMGECTREFEKLPLGRDVNIMRSILYSGVWMKYKKTERAD